jgi:hypothetical protein
MGSTRERAHNLLLPLLIACLTGCVSTQGYLVDRGRDAADIVTATVGVGAGMQARVGPVPLGMLQTTDLTGVRYGETFWHSRIAEEPEERCHTLLALFATVGAFFVPSSGVDWSRLEEVWYHHDRFPLSETQILRRKREKGLASPGTYRLEATAGLGLVLRAGLNCGELLDFVLGWTTVDIFGDDIEKEDRQAPSQTECPGPNRVRERS